MNMKRQLFVSNAVIVLVSLIMLMGVMAVAVKVVERSYAARFEDFRQISITDRNGDVTVFDNPEGKERQTELYDRYKHEITVLFIFFLSVGIAAVVFIFILTSIFTRLILRRIMKPIETLCSAARRIGTENLDEAINYDRDDEFKEVCDAFDEMQMRLKEGIEKNLSYEKARTTMITDISHDMRTPLTSVKGFLKGIMDGVADTPEKREEYVKIAYKKACSMDVLLDKLFYFSKLETDNLPIYTVKTDMKRYLYEYTESIKSEIRGRGADISFECDDGTYFSRIDKEQMDRVLDNLTENAVKYNENVKIKINLFSDGENNIFSVSDNGKGVDEDKTEHLFERFYRADPSRSTAKSGSGLGLYIVKRIAQLHGGDAAAQNDKGLKITITLPKEDTEDGQSIDS